MLYPKLGLTLVVVPVVHALKVEDSGVVKVLAREDDVIQISGMGVGDGMTCRQSISTSSVSLSVGL